MIYWLYVKSFSGFQFSLLFYESLAVVDVHALWQLFHIAILADHLPVEVEHSSVNDLVLCLDAVDACSYGSL